MIVLMETSSSVSLLMKSEMRLSRSSRPVMLLKLLGFIEVAEVLDDHSLCVRDCWGH